MFGFVCAHCGQPEIAHYTLEELEEYHRTGLWPDAENQDDPPLLQHEALESLIARRRGYRRALLDCPGFKYKRGDHGSVIDHFAEAVITRPDLVEWAPEEWRAVIEQQRDILDAEQHAERKQRWGGMWSGGTPVCIVWNAGLGASQAFY